ncbi:protein ripply2-like [Lates japonicus]|uniref:Protein ripply2-like protein n=1 Tax=Lates japonicus TaxID=270547 RepID=A0AAD3M9J5_LATJO|nr:protein ripply2-like protein [Lates japonicus]
METFAANSGLTSAFSGDNVTQQSNWWRPWTGKDQRTDAHKTHSMHGDLSDAQCPKIPQVVHPVKLYWPKSRCFDYLYQDAEMLLRNYPVQATICPYEDSSSDEDSDDEEEEVEKELN